MKTRVSLRYFVNDRSLGQLELEKQTAQQQQYYCSALQIYLKVLYRKVVTSTKKLSWQFDHTQGFLQDLKLLPLLH